jgi:hypothetical protein
MITLDTLKTTIQNTKNSKKDMVFYADHYAVHIDFTQHCYMYVVIENLSTYTKTDRIRCLKNYIQRNTQALAYMHSSLAYSKNQEVIVQYLLLNQVSIDLIMQAINFLLQHADILSNLHY